MAAGFTAVAFIKLKQVRTQASQIKQGISGKKQWGSSWTISDLEAAQVPHDTVEDGYDIDYVLIGPTGAYAIETEIISKPVDRDAHKSSMTVSPLGSMGMPRIVIPSAIPCV